jgi:hypothetical protein
MSSTQLVAWATTTVSMREADPGIAVATVTVDADGYRQEGEDWVATSGPLPENWGQSADDPGQLDETAADTELETLGYRRTGSWQESGGQWATDVEQS